MAEEQQRMAHQKGHGGHISDDPDLQERSRIQEEVQLAVESYKAKC